MEQIWDFIIDGTKRFSPYILGGAIGSIIHRLRTNMTIKDFLGSVIVSMFVAFSVGILCKDYFGIQKDTVIFVLCGISGTFSKALLDEIQQLIGNVSGIIKSRYGRPVYDDYPDVYKDKSDI
jgi:hypothetical protein